MTTKEKEVISFRCGDRDKWLDFTNEVKKQRKEVWEVLEKFIDGYIKTKKR